MIPSSPRLVAFAQSECDLTTPILSFMMKTFTQLPYHTSHIEGRHRATGAI